MKEEIEKRISERCEKMQEELNFLQIENAEIKGRLKRQEDQFKELSVTLNKTVEENEEKTHQAIKLEIKTNSSRGKTT